MTNLISDFRRGLSQVEPRLLKVARTAGDSPLLGRIRVLFYLFGLVNLLLAVPGILAGGPLTAGGLLALAALAGVWTWILRQGSFPAALRLVTPVLVFIIALAAVVPEAILGVFYVGLYFGALYGSRLSALGRAVAYFAAFAAADALRNGLAAVADPATWSHAPGAVLSTLVMALLAESVHRQAASEQAKENFLAVVSHELRTPATVVTGMLNTLDRHGDRLDPERRDELLARALRNAERQEILIEELLDVSKILDGRLDPAATQISVHQLITDVTETLGWPASYWELTGSDAVVTADPAHLRIALTNLLSNAEKYGDPPIEVTTGTDHPDTGQLTIRVADHGPGIPETFRPWLFDRFSQASTGTTRNARGFGLGLWIARELVRANGGTIVHEPDRAPGACFALRLPGSRIQAMSLTNET